VEVNLEYVGVLVGEVDDAGEGSEACFLGLHDVIEEFGAFADEGLVDGESDAGWADADGEEVGHANAS
jgi:hypothetical protein